MSHSSITLLTFAATALFVASLATFIYDWLFRYRLALRDRLKGFAADGNDDQAVRLFKDINRLNYQKLFSGQSFVERLQRMSDQAGVNCSPVRFAMWSGVCAIAVAAAFAWKLSWLAIALSPLGTAVPLLVLYARRQVRQRRLCRQLPEAFQMISRAVRAGQTVPAALKIIAEDFDAPISEEFALCYEQQNLGVSRESVLRNLAARTGIMELQIFVVALLVQAKSGGDLVELLDNLASMIRKRLKLKDRVRALTGEGRMQALVLLILPIAALVGIIFLSPQYAQSLLERPGLLAGTAAVQAVGVFWVRRIVNFEY
jgi:tight adherence protein B